MSIDTEAVDRLAERLKSEALDLRVPYREIQGVKIGFPYQDIQLEDWRTSLPDGVWESYEAMENLFSPKNIPPHWIEYLKEISVTREKSGCDFPVNIVDGAFFLLSENPELAREKGIAPIALLPEAGPDVRDAERIKETIDAILADPATKEKLTEILRVLIPDCSAGWMSNEKIARIIAKTTPEKGLFLDLGSGTGKRTLEAGAEASSNIVGIDRQYHPQWYKSWSEKPKKTIFVRADIRELPLADNSVDTALMDTVVQHITLDATKSVMKEVTRALKPQGLLIVGPQIYDYEGQGKGDGYLRFYRKIADEKGWYSLQRVGLSDEVDDRGVVGT